MFLCFLLFFFSSRRRHTRCCCVTGVQTCALPISTNVRIDVTVIDGNGGKQTAQTPAFEIDSTAPTISSHTPTTDARGVPLTQEITIQFSEPMDHAATEGAFVINGGLSWLPTWTGNTLHVSHAPFAENTVYTVTLTGAEDACAPGTPLGGTTSFSFTSAARPTAAVTAPTGGAVFSQGQLITITWTMSDAETNASDLIIYVNYTLGGGAPHEVAPDHLTGVTTYTWTAPAIDAADVR